MLDRIRIRGGFEILLSYRDSLLPGPRQTKPRGGAAVPYTPCI
jgi:hypothetical protein